MALDRRPVGPASPVASPGLARPSVRQRQGLEGGEPRGREPARCPRTPDWARAVQQLQSVGAAPPRLRVIGALMLMAALHNSRALSRVDAAMLSPWQRVHAHAAHALTNQPLQRCTATRSFECRRVVRVAYARVRGRAAPLWPGLAQASLRVLHPDRATFPSGRIPCMRSSALRRCTLTRTDSPARAALHRPDSTFHL